MMRRIVANWPFDWLDGVALLGLVLLAGGLYVVYPPAAISVVGALLIVYAFLAARPARSES